jgi:hypothetical protein
MEVWVVTRAWLGSGTDPRLPTDGKHGAPSVAGVILDEDPYMKRLLVPEHY